MVTKAPKYVLTAMDEHEDKDKQIAKLNAMVEEREKVAKKAMEDKEHMEAMDETHKEVAKAIKAAYEHDGREIPVVKAKLQAMHDEEKDEVKKAIYKAALDVFDEGNGTQVKNQTQVGDTLNEPETKVVEAAVAKAIRPFQLKEMKPVIAKILKANKIGGATTEQLTSLQKSLVAKTYDELATYEKENSILIASLLQRETSTFEESALVAKLEDSLPFNGESSVPLVGNSISIDQILEEAPSQ